MWWINQARRWIFHVAKHVSRTHRLECAFPAVIGDKHERGGLRYGGTAALSTLPAARRAPDVNVIACRAGAWAELQLGLRYSLRSTPPGTQADSNITTLPGISRMFGVHTGPHRWKINSQRSFFFLSFFLLYDQQNVQPRVITEHRKWTCPDVF